MAIGLFACAGTLHAADNAQTDIPANVTRLSTNMVKALRPKQLTVETGLGTLRISFQLLAAIENTPSGSASLVHTVYGETFVCKTLPQSIFVQFSGNTGIKEKSDKNKRAISKFEFDNEQQPVPSGWLAWRMEDGNSFYARIAQEQSGRAGSSVVLVKPDKNGFVILKDQTSGKKSPLPEKISLRLLSDSRIVQVSLSSVESAGSLHIASLPPGIQVIRGLSPYLSDSIKLGGGSFVMGCTNGEGLDDELPPHRVIVSPFRIDACEVTKAQFAEFTRDTGYKTDAEKKGADKTWRNPGFVQNSREPVVCVSWYDAVTFCNWRSAKSGLQPCYEFRKDAVTCDRDKNGYRLPTEAEWEYAASSGGTASLYPFNVSGAQTNESIDEKAAIMALAVKSANFQQSMGMDNAQDDWLWTSPVKSYPPNAFGLYDMAGNVWEWCQDWYFGDAYRAIHSRRPGNPCVETDDVAGLKTKVMRGGSFENPLEMLRIATRGNGSPAAFTTRVGFRCARGCSEEK